MTTADDAWTWAWWVDHSRSQGKSPGSLCDGDGPWLDDPLWLATRMAIFRFATDIEDLRIARSGRRIEIDGKVHSAEARLAIAQILAERGEVVRNDIEITPAPVYQPEHYPETEPGPGSGSISRDAMILAINEPVAGRPFAFTVDLVAKLGLEEESDGWGELTIDVNVIAPQMEFPHDGKCQAGTITLFRNGASRAARFEAPIAVGADTVEIRAYFTHERRHSGMATRSFTLSSAAADEGHVRRHPIDHMRSDQFGSSKVCST